MGQDGLRRLGIPEGAEYICLIVRDSRYLEEFLPNTNWGYHEFRDANVQNYGLAAIELANRGYYVIRMGASVREPIRVSHERVIDYAAIGMRTDFMDIYLGGTCKLAITSGTGWDAVPTIFRRPVVYTDFVPLGYLHTYRVGALSLAKHFFSERLGRRLTLRESFDADVGYQLYTSEYLDRGIRLENNSPEEIRDAAVEMQERIDGTWRPQAGDNELQARLWEIYPLDAIASYNGNRLHGRNLSRYSAHFLRDNAWWLA